MDSKKISLLTILFFAVLFIAAFQPFASSSTPIEKIDDCTCGTTCVGDPGGVCTFCSEWTIGQTNAPCDDDTPVEKE